MLVTFVVPTSHSASELPGTSFTCTGPYRSTLSMSTLLWDMQRMWIKVGKWATFNIVLKSKNFHKLVLVTSLLFWHSLSVRQWLLLVTLFCLLLMAHFIFRKSPALRNSLLTQGNYCIIQLPGKNLIYLLLFNPLKERVILVRNAMLTFLGQWSCRVFHCEAASCFYCLIICKSHLLKETNAIN